MNKITKIFLMLLVILILSGCSNGMNSYKRKALNHLNDYYPNDEFTYKDTYEYESSNITIAYNSKLLNNEEINVHIVNGSVLYDDYLAKKYGSKLQKEAINGIESTLGISNYFNNTSTIVFDTKYDPNATYEDAKKSLMVDSTIIARKDVSSEEERNLYKNSICEYYLNNKINSLMYIYFTNETHLDLPSINKYDIFADFLRFELDEYDLHISTDVASNKCEASWEKNPDSYSDKYEWKDGKYQHK